MASRETIKLTANPSPEQAGTLLDVNEELHALALRLKARKPEDVARALRLVEQYGKAVMPVENEMPESLKKLEMTVDLNEYISLINEESLVSLDGGLAFAVGDNGDYNVYHFQNGKDTPEIGPPFTHLPGKIVDLNGSPCYRAMSDAHMGYCIFVGGEIRDTKDYLDIGDPINFNGKLAYPALKDDGKWVVVINGVQKKINFNVTSVNAIAEIDGKLLIDMTLASGSRFVMYNDRVCSNVNDDEPVSPFFVINGNLAYYSKRPTGLILVTNNTETPTVIKSGDEVTWAKNIDGKNVYIMEQNGYKHLIEEGHFISDWCENDSKALVPPVSILGETIFAYGKDDYHWYLGNKHQESIEIPFEEVYSVEAIDDEHCLILGLKEMKYIKKVINVSQLLKHVS